MTPAGVVKLLDFGLAKPLSAGAGEGSTAALDSVLVTEEGLILGTPTYMSPEQARGRLVDRRTDVWAFGCVLYECLTGRRAFGGGSVTDALAVVLAVTRPDARDDSSAPTGPAAPAPAVARPEPPHFEQRTFGRQVVFNARFMPDGQSVVYASAPVGNLPRVYLLRPGSVSPQEIAPDGTLLLSVSPGGELAVLTGTTYRNHRVHEGTLARMSLDGAPRPLVESVRDADWGPDGELAVVRRVGGLDRLEYPLGTVLYETAGYVSEPRVSADGAQVAFLDHPVMFDDRGWLKLVDRTGTSSTLTEEYPAIEGLAWTPGGERLLFSAALDWDEVVLSVGRAGGDARLELGTPGEVIVLDAAPDGRLLAMEQQTHNGVAARLPGADKDVDLSWLDSSWGGWLSPDRSTVLFTNGRGGANYTVVTRGVDGSPITTLGEGSAAGYSPDGRWAAALISSPPSIALYPTGAGSPRRLDSGAIERIESVDWMPDGQHLLVSGSEAGRLIRTYRLTIAGGDPEAVTPEGLTRVLPSPQGDRVLARDPSASWKIYPLDGGEPRVAPGSGQVGIWLTDPVLEPERGYGYSYGRSLSTLYVVDGLR